MNSYVFTFQCHCCRRQIDSRKERIVTEACGHSKCRKCFIKEESGCVKCLSSGIYFDSIIDQSDLKQNSNKIQNTHVPFLQDSNYLDKATNSSKSKTSDIRVLEEVIIKPFVDIPSTASKDIDLQQSKVVEKFVCPSHITWRIINGEREFECKICKKTFRSKSNRRYHVYCDKTIEKPFSCSKCSQVSY